MNQRFATLICDMIDEYEEAHDEDVEVEGGEVIEEETHRRLGEGLEEEVQRCAACASCTWSRQSGRVIGNASVGVVQRALRH